MKTIYIKQALFTLLCIAGTACTNEDYQLYDTTQKDSAFIEYINEKDEVATSVTYSFGFDIATEYVVELPVKLMGMTSDKARAFTLEPAEGTTMQEGVHYTIDKEAMSIPANGVDTKVKITLLRNNDPELQQKEFTLNLILKESDDLAVVGQNQFSITYSDIHPEYAPSWWVSWAMPPYRYDVAQKFFELFYAMEDVNPAVIDEMVTRYGDYFVNATSMQGPLVMYSSFMNKYVLIPLYEYYEVHDPSAIEGWAKPSPM